MKNRLDKSKLKSLKSFLLLILIALLFLNIGCLNGNSKRGLDQQKKSTPLAIIPDSAIMTGSDELFDDYQNDEAMADKKYLGKSINLVGIAKKDGISMLGISWVVIRVDQKSPYAYIQCFAPNKNEFVGVKTGQLVFVKGICTAKFLGHVKLRSCTLYQQ